jgi:hypothetical protein
VKRIIGGKAYNTETATRVEVSSLQGYWRGADGALYLGEENVVGTVTVYQTTDGAFFVVREVEEGCVAKEGDPGFFPMTLEDVIAWGDRHERQYEIRKGPKPKQMLLRIPPILRDRIKEAAEANGWSVNTLVIRLLEAVSCAHVKHRVMGDKSVGFVEFNLAAPKRQ